MFDMQRMCWPPSLSSFPLNDPRAQMLLLRHAGGLTSEYERGPGKLPSGSLSRFACHPPFDCTAQIVEGSISSSALPKETAQRFAVISPPSPPLSLSPRLAFPRCSIAVLPRKACATHFANYDLSRWDENWGIKIKSWKKVEQRVHLLDIDVVMQQAVTRSRIALV